MSRPVPPPEDPGSSGPVAGTDQSGWVCWDGSRDRPGTVKDVELGERGESNVGCLEMSPAGHEEYDGVWTVWSCEKSKMFCNHSDSKREDFILMSDLWRATRCSHRQTFVGWVRPKTPTCSNGCGLFWGIGETLPERFQRSPICFSTVHPTTSQRRPTSIHHLTLGDPPRCTARHWATRAAQTLAASPSAPGTATRA